MTPKLTDEQIIMALKYCTKDNGICNRNCPLWKNLTACVCARDCNISLMRMALVLINLLKEENREITRKFNSQQKVYSDLHHIIQSHAEELKTVKAEAYKEFAERLKEKKRIRCVGHGDYDYAVDVYDIDRVYDEMVNDE